MLCKNLASKQDPLLKRSCRGRSHIVACSSSQPRAKQRDHKSNKQYRTSRSCQQQEQRNKQQEQSALLEQHQLLLTPNNDGIAWTKAGGQHRNSGLSTTRNSWKPKRDPSRTLKSEAWNPISIMMPAKGTKQRKATSNRSWKDQDVYSS